MTDLPSIAGQGVQAIRGARNLRNGITKREFEQAIQECRVEKKKDQDATTTGRKNDE